MFMCRRQTERVNESVTEDTSKVIYGRVPRADRLACKPRAVIAHSDVLCQRRGDHGPTDFPTQGRQTPPSLPRDDTIRT